MRIRVYTNPDCVQCDTTKRYLDRHGIRYDTVDLSQDPISLDMVQSLGYAQVPVVYLESKQLGVKHWSGFRSGELANLVRHFNQERRDTPITQ
jgi:glutaredoxin-like protein NrdH